MTVVLAVAVCSCLCQVAIPFLVFGWPLCILGKCVAVGWLGESASAGRWVAERSKGGLGENLGRDFRKDLREFRSPRAVVHRELEML